ncbi:MAG: [FeFe] hydrogenase H-cluster maturation GTPase HydF [Calditrichia bacterium]
MKKTPQSERLHIAIFGRRNAGKSSLINRLTNQDIALVSDVPGTTTDPVYKSMELLPLGPVVIIDTAGIDDVGKLGEQRILRTRKVLSKTDFAIIVIDSRNELSNYENELIVYLKENEIPFIVVLNKIDTGVSEKLIEELTSANIPHFKVSCATGEGIEHLKNALPDYVPKDIQPPLVADLINAGEMMVLVVPIDLGAPKGRLIMPQVQTIRESIDQDALTLVVKEKELKFALEQIKYPPKLVVTDSQAIMRVMADVPDAIPLTTFSILMARYKGDLPTLVKGLAAVEKLNHGDHVLIAEACTHHAQEDDIGKVKIPRWLRNFIGKDVQFHHVNGFEFPENLHKYKLIIHCGSCMLNRRGMMFRIRQAARLNIPIVNYGVLISYLHGAIPRVLKPFPEALQAFEESGL